MPLKLSILCKGVGLLSTLRGTYPTVFFKDTLQDGYFDIILYKRQIRWSSALKHIPLRMPCAHRTPSVGAELDSFTSFSVCMFKLWFVFVHSGAAGSEGELGSVLLSVRHGSLCVHRTLRASVLCCIFFNSTYISLLIILCMIVYVTNNKEPWTLNLEYTQFSFSKSCEWYKSFWMFKLARLKYTCKWQAFVTTCSSGLSTVLSVFFRPQPVSWDRRGPHSGPL